MSSLEVSNKIMEQQTNMSPEEQERQKQIREHLCECETLFVNKIHDEIGETTDVVDVNRLMDMLQPFKDRCRLLHGVGQWTQGHEISDLLSLCLKQNMPKDHIWEHVDRLNRQTPQFFDSKEIKSLIRKLGFNYILKVTCDQHHPAQMGHRRGQVCNFQESNECQPCSSILKLGIRYDTIKSYLSRKLLEPGFGTLIRSMMKMNNFLCLI